jgi:Coenzyme PQQ synthesis protein D (PqqD)
MKIKEGFILKDVANQYVVVPIGNEAINFNGMLRLNKTAKLLFEALREEKEIDDLVLLLQEHYDINKDDALRDVKDFLKVLESKNILL